MPRGVPNRVTDGFKRDRERVRVVVWLDRRAVEDLEVMVRYRHRGRWSRSAVVREAVSWLIAKESMWITRAHARAEREARDAAEEARRIKYSRQERDEIDERDRRDAALAIARQPTEGVG